MKKGAGPPEEGGSEDEKGSAAGVSGTQRQPLEGGEWLK